MLLGEAEAAAYSECVQESDAQVPLGFKFVPLSQVFTSAVATSPTLAPTLPGTPASATASVDFGTTGGLGIDALLKEQECDRMAAVKGAAVRAARLSDAEDYAKAEASAAWVGLQSDLEKCTQLKQAQRGRCVRAAKQWLSQARAMPVSIPAGVEPIETACGLKQPAFAEDSRTVAAEEVSAAEAILARLEAPDDAKGGGGAMSTGDPVILGALDRSLTDAVIKRHVNQIRDCYQRELTKNPNLGGKIVVKFVIAKDGSVSKASLKSSSMGNRSVTGCITGQFMRFKFPEPKGGGIVIVSYPFIFSPQ